MGPATTAWTTQETDPQRIAILAAADRLLSAAPRRSTGNLSVVQLASEADVKYWIVAQKHTDLRDHFQRLAATARRPLKPRTTTDDLQDKHDELREHCASLEALLQTYANVIIELARENEALRAAPGRENITPFKRAAAGPGVVSRSR
jgi:hypothetical protein